MNSAIERSRDEESKQTISVITENNETVSYIPDRKKRRKHSPESEDIFNAKKSSDSSDQLFSRFSRTGADKIQLKGNTLSKGSEKCHKTDCSLISNHSSESSPDIVELDFSPGSKLNEIPGKITVEEPSSDVAFHVTNRNNNKAYIIEKRNTSEITNAAAGPSGIRPQRIKPGKSKFACNMCDKAFTKKYNFDMHYRTHIGEKHYVCEVCQIGFATKGSLEKHYVTHTGERPFECDICGRKFARKAYLDEHYKTHTYEKPHVCKVCQKGFAQKGTLNTHYRTHTAERPFVCEACKKGFTTRFNLTKHEQRWHKGEQTTGCNICGKDSIKSCKCNEKHD